MTPRLWPGHGFEAPGTLSDLLYRNKGPYKTTSVLLSFIIYIKLFAIQHFISWWQLRRNLTEYHQVLVGGSVIGVAMVGDIVFLEDGA